MKGTLKLLLKDDLYRITGKRKTLYILFYLLKAEYVFLFCYRITRHFFLKKYKILFKISNIFLRFFSIKFGYEIPPQTKIGNGVKLMHFGGVAINPLSEIGRNVTISKGVTIGSNRRGKNKGAPLIGDDVFIGANAAIIGGVSIGDNVMIAPNAYINFDVPSHSICLGNPGRIISAFNATEFYQDNIYND